MTNPYNTAMPYGQNIEQNNFYQQKLNPYQYQQNNNSVIGNTIKAGALGFAGGTLITGAYNYYKNRKPINSNGEVTDSFAKKVLDKIIHKDYVVKGKEFFKEKCNVLKKLDSIKTPEKFKKLMEKNRKYCSTLCDGISLNTMCNTVTEENLKDKISALKKRIQASMEPELQNIKDMIKLCWDKENKKFEKYKFVDNKFFNIIKDTKNDINWKQAFKKGGIVGGCFAALSLGLSLFANYKNNQ